MVNNKRTIVVTTGGTGGHMFPAASFAENLVSKGHKIALITDERGSKFKGIFIKHPIYKIKASSPSGNIIKRCIGLFNLCVGIFQAFLALGKIKPNAIAAFGGYASAPTVIAGMLRRIPIILHEQNAILGRANRFSVKFAKILALSFVETKKVPKSAKTVHVGMPIRPEIKSKANSKYPELTKDNEFNILIFGGSQGAKIFSMVIPYGISLLDEKYKKRINILQQCREEEIDEVRKVYEEAGINVQLGTFFASMEKKIENAHLLMCRGGSSTLAESNAIGRPAVIIPLKVSRDGDQIENATFVQEKGAGWIMAEDNFNPSEVKKILEYLMNNPVFLQEAAYNASTLGVVNADEKLAELVLKESK